MIYAKCIQRVVLLFLSMLLMFTPIYCFAYEYNDSNLDECELRYEAKVTVRPSLSISSGKAYSNVSLKANAGDIDKAEIRVVLERKIDTGYLVEKTWRDQTVTFSSAGSVSWSKSHTLKTNGTYRIRVSGILYKDGTELGSFTDETSSMVVY